MDSGTQDLRGVGEDADACLWEIVVAQTDGVIDDLREVGVQGGFAVACKGEDIGRGSFCLHELKACLECVGDFLGRRHAEVGAVPGVEAAFAIDAVEGTDFSVGRKQVDAE